MIDRIDSPSRVSPTDRLRIIVLGYIVRGPVGGLAWHHLQYSLGLSLLGHDVYYVEDSGDDPSCYDAERDVVGPDATWGVAYLDRTFTRVGLANRWTYFDAPFNQWRGPLAERIGSIARSADLLLDISGVNQWRPWMEQIPIRLLVDTDPVFTQLTHLQDGSGRDRAWQHNRFYSFGENVGSSDCSIPDDGLPWRPTRQPIVLGEWPVVPAPEEGRFTTIMLWDSYKAREHEGRAYGQKSASFGPYLDLPTRTSEVLQLAVGSPTAPREQLSRHGWRLVDPLAVSRDPWDYQRYIQGSKGEFTVAKHGYVESWSGWFSERSACYLASGRPVVTQDTGFSEVLPTGDGLLAFRNADEAIECIERVASDYRHHCAAAREVAETWFDGRTILTDLLEDAMSGPPV
jgi:hypothetical protein